MLLKTTEEAFRAEDVLAGLRSRESYFNSGYNKFHFFLTPQVHLLGYLDLWRRMRDVVWLDNLSKLLASALKEMGSISQQLPHLFGVIASDVTCLPLASFLYRVISTETKRNLLLPFTMVPDEQGLWSDMPGRPYLLERDRKKLRGKKVIILDEFVFTDNQISYILGYLKAVGVDPIAVATIANIDPKVTNNGTIIETEIPIVWALDYSMMAKMGMYVRAYRTYKSYGKGKCALCREGFELVPVHEAPLMMLKARLELTERLARS